MLTLKIIPRNYLAIFDEDQLEKLLAGTIEINMEDWRQHSEYKGGYSSTHVAIRWFWAFVYELQNEARLKLLQVPISLCYNSKSFTILFNLVGLTHFFSL